MCDLMPEVAVLSQASGWSHSFIQQAFIECLSGLGTVLGIEDIRENETGKDPSLCGAFI